MTNNDFEFITPLELSEMFHISQSTQAKWRMKKSKMKIPYVKLGKKIFYKFSDIKIWLEDNKFNSS